MPDRQGDPHGNGYSEWVSEVRRLYVEPKNHAEIVAEIVAEESAAAPHGDRRGRLARRAWRKDHESGTPLPRQHPTPTARAGDAPGTPAGSVPSASPEVTVAPAPADVSPPPTAGVVPLAPAPVDSGPVQRPSIGPDPVPDEPQVDTPASGVVTPGPVFVDPPAAVEVAAPEVEQQPLGETVVPAAHDPLPVEESIFPVADSAGHDPQPAGKPVVPAAHDPLPAGEPVVPAAHDPLPAGEPVVPAAHDPLPAGEPVVPAAHDPLPAGEPVVPAADSAAHDSQPESAEPTPHALAAGTAAVVAARGAHLRAVDTRLGMDLGSMPWHALPEPPAYPGVGHPTRDPDADGAWSSSRAPRPAWFAPVEPGPVAGSVPAASEGDGDPGRPVTVAPSSPVADSSTAHPRAAQPGTPSPDAPSPGSGHTAHLTAVPTIPAGGWWDETAPVEEPPPASIVPEPDTAPATPTPPAADEPGPPDGDAVPATPRRSWWDESPLDGGDPVAAHGQVPDPTQAPAPTTGAAPAPSPSPSPDGEPRRPEDHPDGPPAVARRSDRHDRARGPRWPGRRGRGPADPGTSTTRADATSTTGAIAASTTRADARQAAHGSPRALVTRGRLVLLALLVVVVLAATWWLARPAGPSAGPPAGARPAPVADAAGVGVAPPLVRS